MSGIELAFRIAPQHLWRCPDMTTLSADVPIEPPDRAVVLDRERQAWQRRDDLPQNHPSEDHRRWVAVLINDGRAWEVATSWRHLIVDRGPLTLLTPDTPRAPS